MKFRSKISEVLTRFNLILLFWTIRIQLKHLIDHLKNTRQLEKKTEHEAVKLTGQLKKNEISMKEFYRTIGLCFDSPK